MRLSTECAEFINRVTPIEKLWNFGAQECLFFTVFENFVKKLFMDYFPLFSLNFQLTSIKDDVKSKNTSRNSSGQKFGVQNLSHIFIFLPLSRCGTLIIMETV